MESNIIKTNIKPSSIQLLGNGYYYYNYNVTESTEQVFNEEIGKFEDVTYYNFTQIKLYGTPNYRDCAKAVIRTIIDENDEFSLINKYNAYTFGLYEDETVVAEYKEYLRKLNEIKTNVKKDF